MRYLTDRKQAQGLGSGREGTHHHWQMIVSSVLLAPLVSIFVIFFASALGSTQAGVMAYFSRPLVAVFTTLAIVVIILHLMNEALAAIEDYVHGVPGKLALIGTRAFAYTLIAIGVFALARMAL